jgi:exonuclease III
MKIISWNCHYGFDVNKVDEILKFNADIYVIQECKKSDFDSFKKKWKYRNWYGDDHEFSDLGVAVFSNNCKIEFSDEFNRNFRYIIPYRISDNDKHFTLFAVWTKPVPFYYDENLKKAITSLEYKHIMENSIIIGDFNTGYNNEHEERYNGLINNLEKYINCAIISNSETIPTYFSDSKNKLFVNDFCFISRTLYKNLSNVNLKIDNIWDVNEYEQKRWKSISDHCPIILTFNWNDYDSQETEFTFDPKVAFEETDRGLLLSKEEISKLLSGVDSSALD